VRLTAALGCRPSKSVRAAAGAPALRCDRCLKCPRLWLLPGMQPAPFLQQLFLGLTPRRVGHAGACGAYPGTMRSLIGSHALGASVRIDGVRGADGFIGAPWPTVSAQPGHRSASLSEDFVGYRLSFLSGLVFTIVTFLILNVNQKRWAIYRLGVQRG
jgi:hypothetical protein